MAKISLNGLLGSKSNQDICTSKINSFSMQFLHGSEAITRAVNTL